MTGTSAPSTYAASTALAWNPDMAAMRDALIARALRNDIPVSRSDLDAMESLRSQREHCNTVQATTACGVVVRYLFSVAREAPPQRAFAQMLFDFEMASA